MRDRQIGRLAWRVLPWALGLLLMMHASRDVRAADATPVIDGFSVQARARDAALSDDERRQLLDGFEADLARIDAELNAHAAARNGVSPVAKWLPGSDTGAAVRAAQQLQDAVGKLADAMHWPAQDEQPARLSFLVFSTPPAASLTAEQSRHFAATYAGGCEGLGDYVFVSGGVATAHLLAGLFRRVGAFVEIDTEKVAYGAVCMSLPFFTVHRKAATSVVAADPKLAKWLRDPQFAAEVGALYDTAIASFQVTVFDDAVTYAHGEAARAQLHFGKIDRLSTDAHILLSTVDAEHFDGAQAAFRGVWFESVRIHEMLHVLHRSPCDGGDLRKTLPWKGVSLTVRDLREVQAEVGTIASYASADSDMLAFVLMRSLKMTKTQAYRLSDDFFFEPLLLLTAQRQLAPLLATGAATRAQLALALPGYMRLADHGAGAREVATPATTRFATLTLDGVIADVVAAPSYFTYEVRLALLIQATHKDALAMAKAALDTVIAQQALLCGAR